VIEEARPVQSGVELLTQTRENWLDSLIGSHINWHLALYYYAKTALEGGTLTEREERHVQALLAYAEGQLPTAIDHWAAILVNYPRDLLATHMLFVACKMLGMFARARDTLARRHRGCYERV
jgi:hypothetical protein